MTHKLQVAFQELVTSVPINRRIRPELSLSDRMQVNFLAQNLTNQNLINICKDEHRVADAKRAALKELSMLKDELRALEIERSNPNYV